MKTKLAFLFLFSLFFANISSAQNWIDTLYTIETIEDISYGNTVDFAGVDRELYLDISYPIGDIIPECGRPLLVMVHGGAWIAGDKAAGYSLKIRKDFAKRGYTTASVNYRLGQFHTDQNVHCNVDGWDCFNMTDSSEWYRANYRSIQDVSGAIRFLVNNASTYDINPDNIFVVGESAGGFIAMGVGFIDDTTEILNQLIDTYPDAPTPNAIYENACIQGFGLATSIMDMDLSRPALGSYEGTLNFPVNNSFEIKGIGNFYGGAFNNIFQTYDENTHTPALYMYHQPCDLIVPYHYGSVFDGFVNCFYSFPFNCGDIINRPFIYGSAGVKNLIDTMADNDLLVPEYLFDNTNNQWNCIQQANPAQNCHAIDNYWLRTSNMATFFADKIDSCFVNGITLNEIDKSLNLYPSPVSLRSNLYIKGTFEKGDKIILFDINGRKVYEEHIITVLSQQTINTSMLNIKSGVYFIQINSQNSIKTLRMLVVD